MGVWSNSFGDTISASDELLNSDFGGIFAELLPGNFAKLQPPEGQDLMQGLEVKVQLGSVWKQSLTELSGGQRLVLFSWHKKNAICSWT
jgi:structural maintenance of chromosome 2